jgi:hypothetical protein
MSNADDEPRVSGEDDLDVTAEEAAEAEALAHALAGKSVHLQGEVLEGVGLMRLSRRELSVGSSARIEAELLTGRGPTQGIAQPRRSWWWIALAALAPAAVIVLVLRAPGSKNEAEMVAVHASLPSPEIEVLQAQASWLNSDAERPGFEREMHAYRKLVLASLDSP